MTHSGCSIANKILKPISISYKKKLSCALLCLVLPATHLFSGCDSAAQVEWENQSRTAMGNKLGGAVSNPNVSAQYKTLTAKLSEEERALINTLLETILSKDSTQLDIGATVESAIAAVEDFTLEPRTRERLEEALNLKIKLAESSDTALMASFNGVLSAEIEQKFDYLQGMVSLNEFASKNSDFKKTLDSQLPKVPNANLPETALIWSALSSEADVKSEQMGTILKVASFASEANFSGIATPLKDKLSQESLTSLLKKLNLADTTAQDFLSAIASISPPSYPNISSLVDRYNSSDSSLALKSAVKAVVKKTFAIESLLRKDFISVLASSVSESDAVVRLNRINASTDTLQGSGFYDTVDYTNKYITNKEALSCAVLGSGLSNVTYSFKWTDGGALTLFDWTTPSSVKSSTSKIFNIDETAQCFARVYIDNVQAVELSAEKVTVKSAPPEFESGDPPTVSNVSIYKGENLTHTAETAEDPNAGDSVFYRLVSIGERGNTVQSSETTFTYTPLPTYVGEDEFSYVACDQNFLCSLPKVVKVTINPANLRPTIFGIEIADKSAGNPVAVSDKTITLPEDHIAGSSAEVLLRLEDDELGLVSCSSTVTITSNDTSIVENNSTAIKIFGTFPNCGFSLTPKPNAYGTTQVIVSVTDGVDPTPATDTFNVIVNNVNDAPTANLSAVPASLTEDTPSAPFSISVIDPDGPAGVCDATHIVYTSSAPSIIAASGALQISGTWPNCSAVIIPVTNQVTAPMTPVTVELKVWDGLVFSSIYGFPVTVNAVNDAPVFSNGNNTVGPYNEDSGNEIFLNQSISVSDVDHTQLTEAVIEITSNYETDDELIADVSGTSIEFALESPGKYKVFKAGGAPIADFISVLQSVKYKTTSLNPTANGTKPNRTVTWNISDGTASALPVTTTFAIMPNDDPAVVTPANQTPFPKHTEKGDDTLIDGNIGITDVDSPNIVRATITVHGSTTNDNQPILGDTLLFTNTDKITGTFETATGVLQLLGTATVSEYQDALRTIAYKTTSLDPTNEQRKVKWIVNDGENNSVEKTTVIDVQPVNDAPAGTVTCSTLNAANVYISGVANGAGWSLDTCAGATDPEGDTITYKLDYIATGATSSGAYPCPNPIQSAAGGTSIAGNFPTGLGVYGSCQYKLKACDTGGLCTAASANSVLISSYQINLSTPATPTLSAACVVQSSSTINVTDNLSNVTWKANTNAPSSTDDSTSVSVFPATATFNTDISAIRLGATFLPTTPTKTTSTTAASAAVEITAGTLAAAIGNPPTTQITTSASSSALYTITRALEALLLRSGDAQGAADTYEEIHVDGQQPKYATTAGCQTCTNGPIASISTGDTHTCVVEANGSSKCWGNNTDGRLGKGSNSAQFAMPQSVSTTNITGRTHTQIAAGSNFTCLLGTTTQGVTCWGNNSSMQLGLAAGSSINAPPATVVGGTGFTNPIAVSASKTGEHACAITTAGSAYCWGDNSSSQLGDNGSGNSSTAIEALTAATTPLTKVRSIAAGGEHTCAAVSFDTTGNEGIYCWGKNDKGQLGDGTTTDRGYATVVDETNSGLNSATTWFTQVVAGAAHTCALRTDGAVFCWGDNASGQLGDNSTTDRLLPTGVNGLGSGSGVVALSAGAQHTCALKSNHEVVCWGENDKGQLGNNSATDSAVPVTAVAANVSTAVALSAGGSHTCAASFDGTVRCWGSGELGQLGDNVVDASADGANDDCDAAGGSTSYCSKTAALVNWTSGVTSNATLRPKTCHKYSIP